ncbi:MAG TPA: response regulator, partial [Egibacteraceae bacterium]|nr:response regulator [Egibacteraceae bacterium]
MSAGRDGRAVMWSAGRVEQANGESGQGAAPDRRRILVVDDDEMIRELLHEVLTQAGYRVRTADSGDDALAKLHAHVPGLVLSDINMPGMDGFAFLAALRANAATRAMPLIFLTARDGIQDLVEGFALGADDYVTKPVAIPELLARVRAKLARPPVPLDDLGADPRSGLLSTERLREELRRETLRTRRGGTPGVFAQLSLSELDSIRLRLGTEAERAVLEQLAGLLTGLLRPLDLSGLLGDQRIGVLLPETGPEDAARRLGLALRAISAHAFVAGGSTLRLTPSAGYAPLGGRDADGGPDDAEPRAGVALDYAEAHLDLLPLRWEPRMEAVVEALRQQRARDRLRLRRDALLRAVRTPLQIAATAVVGLVLPYLGYLWLWRAGHDITGVVYLVVVGALLVTGILIWMEGIAALRRPAPPDEPGAPEPPASAVIAAYLPNEAATIVETIEAFLRIDYPDLEVVLAYNTPEPMAVEARLRGLAKREPRFRPFRVDASTSKAQNVNAALSTLRGEFVGVFDADHHPEPDSFRRAWRWLSNGYDVVQGHCVVRNGDASRLARLVAVEFEAIYAVSHPGRARLHGFGIFGGSNGYWRRDLLHEIRMRGSMLTEDIDSSLRVVEAGGRIASDPGLISRELGTTTFRQLWNQRMRWAQGWFQVSIRHLWRALRSPGLSVRQKLGALHLLGWREVYPWLSLQMFPII